MWLSGLASAHRAELFVGRAAEERLFRRFAAGEGSHRVLMIEAEGGMGKTTLLRSWASIALADGRSVVYQDAHHLPRRTAAWRAAADRVMAAADGGSEPLWFVDSLEQLGALQSWFWRELLPALPARLRIVTAGREPPDLRWRTDPGWSALVRVHTLSPLTHAEMRAYLCRRGLRGDIDRALLDALGGVPLNAALYADLRQRKGGEMPSAAALADVAELMVRWIEEGMPDDEKLVALYATSLATVTTRGLLSAMLRSADVGALWNGLQRISFLVCDGAGIYPHDLVRPVLIRHLVRERPRLYAQLAHRAFAYLMRRFERSSDLMLRQRLLEDALMLDRETALMRGAYDTGSPEDRGYVEAVREPDLPWIEDMISRHEGELGLALFRLWHERQPGAVRCVRGHDGTPQGFYVALDVALDGDAGPDPIVERFRSALRTGQAQPGGRRALLIRQWMHRDLYQGLGPMRAWVVSHLATASLHDDGLVAAGLRHPADRDWLEGGRAVGHVLLQGSEERTGPCRTVVTYHDWREESAMSVLRRVHYQAHATVGSPPTLLDESEYVHAVRLALKHYWNPERLAANPLIHSKLVQRSVGYTARVAERIAALRTLIQENAQAIDSGTKRANAQRLLTLTYFEPRGNQDAVAEAMHLTPRTYRRHLRRAISLLAGRLQEAESRE